MTVSRMPLPRHYCAEVRPALDRPRILWPCHCGQWWVSVTANDVFTGGPSYIWRRVSWWDLRARRRIHRLVRGRP